MHPLATITHRHVSVQVGATAPAQRPFHIPVISIVGGVAAGMKWGPITGVLTFGGLYLAGAIVVGVAYGLAGRGE